MACDFTSQHFSRTPTLLLVAEELNKHDGSLNMSFLTWESHLKCFILIKIVKGTEGEMTESHWSPLQRQRCEDKERPEGTHMASLPDCVCFHVRENNPKFPCIYFCLL